MNRMKNKRKKGFAIALIVFVGVILCTGVLVFPRIYENSCKTRVYDDMASKIDENILNANICIVTKETVSSDNLESTSYSAGASGVIIDVEDNVYYALTAYHIVSDIENKSWLVIPFNSKDNNEHQNGYSHVTLSTYYDLFPEASVEYTSEEFDLAIIRFETDDKLNVLSVADKGCKYGERIVAISNSDGGRFVQTYGSITSKKIVKFDAHDGKIANSALYHNAYIAHGSSGSAVLNEEMDIAGINIGGGTDFFGNFRYGAMIPCDQIQQFIDNWKSMK